MPKSPPKVLSVANLGLEDDDLVLLHLLRDGPRSRSELAAATGWARNTVVSKLNRLAELGVVVALKGAAQDRGRPSITFELNSVAMLVFVVIFDEHRVTAAICTLAGEAVAQTERPLAKTFGSDQAVRELIDILASLTDANTIDRRQIQACIVGVQGPVSAETSTAAWSRVGVLPMDIADILGVPVVVENDANLMALGAARLSEDSSSLLYILVDVGIGGGLVVDHVLHRGASGWAGEIGHIPIPAAGDRPCICGNRGCVAQIAGNHALLEAVNTDERPVGSLDEMRTLVVAGNLDAIFALRQAGRHIGEAIIGLVVGLAPPVVMVGGQAAQIGDHMVAGVREILMHKMPPALSTRVRVINAPDHREAVFKGGAALGFDRLFPKPVTG